MKVALSPSTRPNADAAHRFSALWNILQEMDPILVDHFINVAERRMAVDTSRGHLLPT